MNKSEAIWWSLLQLLRSEMITEEHHNEVIGVDLRCLQHSVERIVRSISSSACNRGKLLRPSMLMVVHCRNAGELQDLTALRIVLIHHRPNHKRIKASRMPTQSARLKEVKAY